MTLANPTPDSVLFVLDATNEVRLKAFKGLLLIALEKVTE